MAKTMDRFKLKKFNLMDPLLFGNLTNTQREQTVRSQLTSFHRQEMVNVTAEQRTRDQMELLQEIDRIVGLTTLTHQKPHHDQIVFD